MKNKKKQKHFNYSLQEKKRLLEEMMVMERRKGLQEDLKVHRKKKQPSNYSFKEEIKIYGKK